MINEQKQQSPAEHYRSLHEDLRAFHIQRAQYLQNIDPKAALDHILAAEEHQKVCSGQSMSEADETRAFKASLNAFDKDKLAIGRANEEFTKTQHHADHPEVGDNGLAAPDLDGDGLDGQKPGHNSNLIALNLTEEQTKLLISSEYPNDIRGEATALYEVAVLSRPVNIMNESVALDYSSDMKQFYASLNKEEKAPLEEKLTLLLAQQRRAVQIDSRQPPRPPASKDREHERQDKGIEHSR
jgi:hypothetical protein